MKWREVRNEAGQIIADAETRESPCLEDLPGAMEDFHTVSVLLRVAADRVAKLEDAFPVHNPARRILEIIADGLTECEKQRFVLTRAHKSLLHS